MTGRREHIGVVLALLAALAWSDVAAAAEPTLSAYANATRARSSEWMAPVRLVDTSWWITVDGESGGDPLSVIEYQARFTDPEGHDQRPMVGTLELDSASRERVKGRIDIVVPARADYLRPFRVRLRVRDVSDGTSEWVDVLFPVRTSIAPAGETPVAAAAVPTSPGDSHEALGQVETEVDDEASMADVRRALLLQARVRGGTDIENIRLVGTTGSRSTFAAEAVRIVRAKAPPTPPPAPAPEGTPARERILGTISVRHGRP